MLWTTLIESILDLSRRLVPDLPASCPPVCSRQAQADRQVPLYHGSAEFAERPFFKINDLPVHWQAGVIARLLDLGRHFRVLPVSQNFLNKPIHDLQGRAAVKTPRADQASASLGRSASGMA